MSFILDALKKSEAERQRQAGPALLEMRVMRPQRRVPVWLIVIGAVLIVVNLGGLIWLLLRPSPVAPATQVAASPAVGGASSGAPGSPQLAPGERLIGPASGEGQPSLAADGNVPALAGSEEEPVAGDENPADFLPAESGPRRTGTGAALRSYSDVSNTVPSLRLDLHVYDASPSRRYAFINMKRLREGESTANGARLLEITRDGVIMDYRNTQFLLTSDPSAAGESAARGADSR